MNNISVEPYVLNMGISKIFEKSFFNLSLKGPVALNAKSQFGATKFFNLLALTKLLIIVGFNHMNLVEKIDEFFVILKAERGLKLLSKKIIDREIHGSMRLFSNPAM
jgi:hypothetical protein